MEKIAFKISGCSCSEESSIVQNALKNHIGIVDIEFDPFCAKMVITFDPTQVQNHQIMTWIQEAGMKATVWKENKENFWTGRGYALLAMISGVILLVAICFQLQNIKIANYLYCAIIFIGSYYIVPKAYASIKRLRFNMNVLVLIATAGAIGIGEWLEGALMIFLFSIARCLEQWSLRRAQCSIAALMEANPTKAQIVGDRERRVEEVKVGEHVIVQPGEKIPLDGIIEKGTTLINQAPITGESIPVFKEEGEEVYAGTINEESVIEFRVTKAAGDSTLAHITHLVKKARSRRAIFQCWVDKFARIYTPSMIGLSLLIMGFPPLLGGDWGEWFYRGLVVLVIACPCALVISTPVTIVSGLAAALKNGVLIKGGMFLEAAGRLQVIALDKTWTLTYGRPQVQKIWPLAKHTERGLLKCAASLEHSSKHPLAYAILKRAKESGVKVDRVENLHIIKGKGAEGLYRKTRYWIGSHRFMHEMGQETEEIHQITCDLEDAGHSVVAIGNHEHVCGLISIADEPRTNIASIVQEMRNVGIEQLVVLTGDNEQTARAIAAYAGIEEARSELLPEDKADVIKEFKNQGKSIAMIGDGINDAPAMVTADLGIAMGVMGTDVAIETADIALMSDDLAKVPWLICHSRNTVKIIWQNIFISLGIKTIFLGLAIGGATSLWEAITADAIASLLVVFNGLRLIRRL